MISINEFVDDRNINIYTWCIYRDGFVFTAIDEPLHVLDAIVIRNPEGCDCWSPKKSISQHTLAEHIALINQYKLEKAVIIAENIDFIVQCPSLRALEIHPANTAPENFDYSPLYEMPELRYVSCYTMYGGIDEPNSTSIDYRRINGLKEIALSGKGHMNYSKIETVEKLQINGDKSYRDLKGFSGCAELRDVEFFQCGLKTLDGISKLKKLQSVNLGYMRSLTDISELTAVASGLRCLFIENCPKIRDFSCLYDLKKLEHLELYGKNMLPDLKFLCNMKHLKTFCFSMQIEDCDLTPCLQVPYVASVRNRREYNLKDKDLPKDLPEN